MAAEEERFSEPLVPGEVDVLDERVLSFSELMELFVIGFFGRQGVSMPVIRAARTAAQALFQTEYPFATERIATDGRGIFTDLPVAELSAERLKLSVVRDHARRARPRDRVRRDSTQRGMTFVFDNTFPPQLVRILIVLGVDARCLQDDFPASTIDVDWLPEIGRRGWVVVTGDRRISKKPPERNALEEANALAVFMAKGFTANRSSIWSRPSSSGAPTSSVRSRAGEARNVARSQHQRKVDVLT